jgi:hypothetical protein
MLTVTTSEVINAPTYLLFPCAVSTASAMNGKAGNRPHFVL